MKWITIGISLMAQTGAEKDPKNAPLNYFSPKNLMSSPKTI
jgi:hypothetical protein